MKRGPSLPVALIVLIAGLVIAVPAGGVAIVRAVKVINAPVVRTPATVSRQLGRGTWYLFERTGQSSGFVIHRNGPTLDPNQVTVTGPDGSTLPVDFTSANETITRGSQIFTATLQFTVSAPGRYSIRLSTPQSSEVILSRPLIHTFGSILAFIGIGAIGGLLTLAGLVLLVLGSTRRSRAARPVPVLAAPPGWYPDPTGSGQRWWDGRMWTQHQG